MRALLAFLLVAATPRAVAACDVSTDAGLAAAYKAATGRDLPQAHPCARVSSTFAGLVAIGSFAYDRGCRYTDVIASCKLNPKGYAAAAMAKAGWAKAAMKTQLALAWLREIDDRAVIEGIDGKVPGVTEVQTELGKDGSLRVEGWVREPSGMRRGASFTKIRVMFAADGTHGAIETIGSTSTGD
jgi:hypothetical protein